MLSFLWVIDIGLSPVSYNKISDSHLFHHSLPYKEMFFVNAISFLTLKLMCKAFFYT